MGSSYKNIRLKNYDYHNGFFFIINKSDFGQNYFNGEMLQLVRRELDVLVSKTAGVRVDYSVVMPNHIHTILIFSNAALHLSEFWRRYKAITTLRAKKSGFTGKTLWQKNYYEHIIRNETALKNIRTYIQKNPYGLELPLGELYKVEP